MIVVKKDEWTPFIKRIDNLPKEIKHISARTIRNIIRLWVTRAMTITRQYGLIITGNYLNAHKTSSGEVRLIGNTWNARFGNDMPYAGYLEFGTGLYGPERRLIRPKKASVLAWQGKDGKMHFAKWVRGIRPKRVWERALANTDKQVRGIIDRDIQKAIAKLG